jgi:hypothetical protein
MENKDNYRCNLIIDCLLLRVSVEYFYLDKLLIIGREHIQLGVEKIYSPPGMVLTIIAYLVIHDWKKSNIEKRTGACQF